MAGKTIRKKGDVMKYKTIILIFLGFVFFGFLVFYNLKYILKTKATGAELNIRLKLQGDYHQIQNPLIKAKVALYTPYKKVLELTEQPLSQEQDNIFSLKIPINDLDFAQTYSIFIKPEKYLGRFSKGHVFINSQNNVNLTQDLFLAGDVRPFDGKVDAYDLSSIFRDLGKTATLSADTDLNYNLITNTQDYSLALYSLGQNAVDDQIVLATPSATPTPTSTPSATTTPITTTPTNTPTNNPSPTLTSKPTNTPTPAAGNCNQMNNGLPNSTVHYPSASTSLPSTTKEVCANSSNNYYSLPYRNPNCLATENGIRRAYERMRTYYPSYFSQTKLLTDWKTVQNYAIKYNFNPLFVISLWIEESAAGGATAAQQLGCVYRLNKDGTWTHLLNTSTICEQMECLFGYPQVDPANYARWACPYQFGSSQWSTNHCNQAITFTKVIEFWYNYIAENLPSSCQVKYYSPADSRCNQ
jgi:hypothetical protein